MRACRENAFVVNYNLLVKRGWMHFDNACIMFLRLLKRLRIRNVAIAGFDGFGNGYDESYADASLPHIDPGKSWQDLNMEIRDMFQDFKEGAKEKMEIRLLTKSIYGEQV